MSRKNLEYNYPAQRTVGDKILFLIKKHGPMQANEIGQRLGTSGEAARQQFVKLANAGFVEAITEPKGVGRPIQYWHLTELGQKQFPDTHAELTAQILLTIREELGESAIDKIILARKKQSYDRYIQAIKDVDELTERLDILATLRSQEGYMAHWKQVKDNEYLFIENHCPICAAAKVCQGFCNTEKELFSETLGVELQRVEYILEGARRCAYLIKI